jgi:hypothetical protein
MALPATCPDATAISQLVAAQIPQFSDKINFYIFTNSPFANSIEGDTYDSNQSDTILNLVTNRVSPGHSLTRPQFTERSQACGLNPAQDKVGQTSFTTKIETLRGRGPDVCVKQAVSAVKNSYLSAEKALSENLNNLINVDIRAQLHDLSGVKFTANSGFALEDLISGGLNQISVNYPAVGLPDAPMSVLALERLVQFMDDELKLKKYGNGANAHYRVITGRAQNSYFRNELSGAPGSTAAPILLATLQGGFKVGADTLWGYSWQDSTYRGFSLGIDDEPLRFNCLDADGNPIFIEPVIDANGDFGKNGVRNPEWSKAKYEVGFIMAPNSFTRVVPRTFTGEGTFKFLPQMVAGKLDWFYSRDCNNPYGDYGYHLYEVERAYKAEQPHGVMPFIYQRCSSGLGLTPCTEYSNTAVCEDELV